MTDELRNRLERLARRADEASASEAFDRLARARHGRDRSRKGAALVLAFAVAIGGTATALIAFDDDDASRLAGDPPSTVPGSWTPPEVLVVWPENPVTGHTADPAMLQRFVDRGDDGLQWRTDPDEVVRRFAAVVLGWSDATLLERDIETDSGIRSYDIAPCPPGTLCKLEGPTPRLWLVQPASQGDGGIWSVMRVTNVGLSVALPASSPAPIAPGTEIRFELEVPSDRRVHVGIVAANGCDPVGEFSAGLSSGQATLQVPETAVGEGCADVAVGYAFAYAQDDTMVPVGDPLLEAGAIAYPWLTILPVSIDLRAASASPTPAIELTCPDTWTDTIDVIVRNVEMAACSYWRAETPITLRYRSADQDVPVGLEVFPAAACDGYDCRRAPVWRADVTTDARAEYSVPPLEAGTYILRDAVHPVTSVVEIDVR